jgi:hypothetical protein
MAGSPFAPAFAGKRMNSILALLSGVAIGTGDFLDVVADAGDECVSFHPHPASVSASVSVSVSARQANFFMTRRRAPCKRP